ncbi:hypothetical protein L3Q82_001229 [Scortum barcoo]|uniref:Uncharacterized protein n=1 Tax=Scortum barcoo TaxID=214431 RepID=A0ACB8W6F3_9TELE|nr:hypothetical protein L3Q82_001229 [Scortum barcoo]
MVQSWLFAAVATAGVSRQQALAPAQPALALSGLRGGGCWGAVRGEITAVVSRSPTLSSGGFKPLLRTFYETVVASVVSYAAVVCWGGGCSERDKKRLNRLIKRASSVCGCPLDSIEVMGERRALAKLSTIMDNTSHPLHQTVGALSSSFSNRLRHPRCRKERFRSSVAHPKLTYQIAATVELKKHMSDVDQLRVYFKSLRRKERLQQAGLARPTPPQCSLLSTADRGEFMCQMILSPSAQPLSGRTKMERLNFNSQDRSSSPDELEALDSVEDDAGYHRVIKHLQHGPADVERSEPPEEEQMALTLLVDGISVCSPVQFIVQVDTQVVQSTPLHKPVHHTPVLLFLAPAADAAHDSRVIRELLQVAGL